jgi:hypothetical protein
MEGEVMDDIIDLLTSILNGIMAIGGGVMTALGTTGSLLLIVTATIGLVWITGRTLKL